MGVVIVTAATTVTAVIAAALAGSSPNLVSPVTRMHHKPAALPVSETHRHATSVKYPPTDTLATYSPTSSHG